MTWEIEHDEEREKEKEKERKLKEEEEEKKAARVYYNENYIRLEASKARKGIEAN